MTKHFATIDGIKRAATKLKRRTGMSHGHALDQIAREAGYADFFRASQALAAPMQAAKHAVTIYEFWSDRAGGTRGNESRTFLFDQPLTPMLKPHQLTGYLSGTQLSGDDAIIGYGRSESLAHARSEICRIARTLQFMSATGLKPSRGGRCYPKGDQNNRPPGADHDKGWYHPATRSFLLTEEPYPGRHQSNLAARKIWSAKHGWATIQSPWASIYGNGAELYLTAISGGGINLSAMARRLAALDAPYWEGDWPGEPKKAVKAELPPVEFIEMSPELAAALQHQHDLDYADAAPHAPEPSILHRGIRIESRYSSARELETMSEMMDALPDLVRARIESIWCDSKACAFYTVEVKPGRWMQDIEHHIRDAARATTSGFNGLIVREGDREVWFDPEWEGDDYDYGLGEGELPEMTEADLDDVPF